MTAQAVRPVPMVLLATINVSVLLASSLKVLLSVFVTHTIPDWSVFYVL